MSDGSDFVFGTDVERTKRGGDTPETCIEFKGTWLERIYYHYSVLHNELQTNHLFRTGWNKAKSLHKPTYHLSEDEALAVVTYTLETPNVYSTFNRQTRELGPNNPKYEFKAMYYFLSMAINQLSPKYLEIHPYKVYRGVTYDVTDAFVGQPFHFTNFASTSQAESVADNFLGSVSGSRTLFVIETTYKGGKIAEFSRYPGEEEVLIPPCEKFLVTRIQHNAQKQRREIYLQSLDH